MAIQPSSPRLTVIDLDKNGMPLNQPTQQASPVATVYDSCSIRSSDASWWSVERLTQARTMKRLRSFGSSSMMGSSVQKRQRMIGEMLSAAIPTTKLVEVNEENQVMVVVDEMEPAASPEPGPQAVEGRRNVREAMCLACLFRHVDFQELEYEHNVTHVDFFGRCEFGT